MGVKSSAVGVANMRLTRAVAQSRIRASAEYSHNVIVTTHAKKRMRERGFDITDVLRILRTGHVDEDPTREPHGGWHCKVIKRLKSGGRTAGVVTVVKQDDQLIIKTVEWEDGK